MDKTLLESRIKHKVMPVIEGATQKVLGVTIDSLNNDLTEKLTMPSLMSIPIDTSMQFKKAKRKFKIDYIKRMLILNYGNVSEVARKLDIDRRSIHRLIILGKIDVDKIRSELLKVYNFKVSSIIQVIEDVLDDYKEIVHPRKLEEMYKYAPALSEDIIKELPEESLTLKEAEEEFERRYLQKAISEHNNNVSQTAHDIGVRYETLHRKVKELGLI